MVVGVGSRWRPRHIPDGNWRQQSRRGRSKIYQKKRDSARWIDLEHFQFELRFTTGDLSDGASWVSAFQVPDEPLPESSGTDQEYTVTGLFPETTYRFAVKTRDEVEENWSGLSNVVSVTTLPN